MRKVFIVCMLVIASIFLLVSNWCWAQNHTSLSGLSLVADPYTIAGGTSNPIGYLSDGEAVAFEEGDIYF